MKVETILYELVAGIAMATLCACSGDSRLGKPQCIGEPYDVALTADDKELERMAAGMFSEPMKALPQQETPFKTRVIDGINDATRYFRTIVVVKKSQQDTKIKYEKNSFAKGQLMIVVATPSAEALRTDSQKVAKTLQRLIDNHEMKMAISHDAKSHNAALMKTIDETLGCKITIPADMTMWKTGKGFVWISDDGQKIMRNLCIYATKGIRTDAKSLADIRDSVMAANIKGEHDGMYMATERRTGLLFSHDGNSMTMRGLWQMKGDAMGGPFVSRTIIDSTRNRTVTAEAFIYAPATSKARAMKRLESILYTIKLR